MQEVGNSNEAWFMASQHAGAALMPRASTKNLVRSVAVFRPFAGDDLYAEIQLVFRDEPQPLMLASFVDTVLRMRDRGCGATNCRTNQCGLPLFLVRPPSRGNDSRRIVAIDA